MVWPDVYSKLYYPSHGVQASKPFSYKLRDRLDSQQPTALLSTSHDVTDRLIVDILTINNSRMQAVINGEPGVEELIDVEISTFSYKYYANPGFDLTIALQSGEELGKSAAELAIGRIEGTITGSPKSLVVPFELVGSLS